VIAGQAVLTSGVNAGASRAVLLIPTGEYRQYPDPDPTAAGPPIRLSTDNGFLRKADGRLNPLILRPFNPRTLRNRGPN